MRGQAEEPGNMSADHSACGVRACRHNFVLALVLFKEGTVTEI